MSESLPDLREVKSRLQEASTYLRIEEILDRKIELEDWVAQPGFWDDAKGAKKLSQELAEISEDITVYQNLMIKKMKQQANHLTLQNITNNQKNLIYTPPGPPVWTPGGFPIVPLWELPIRLLGEPAVL